MIHELKTIQPYYYDIEQGIKTFEIRKDDRENEFQVGDSLCLKEWTGSRFTGNWIVRRVVYIIKNAPEFGLKPGYCIMGIK